jgi:2-dehydropantoate 2-reductase
MKIAVMGSGAMGGYLGARLATGGAEVSFIARGAHLAAIREHGLKVTSPAGDMLIDPVTATDEPAEIGNVDLVLLAVKMYDLETVADFIRPMVGAETGIVTLQNGVDAPGVIAGLFGTERTIGGVCVINGEIAAPGVIQHNALNAVIVGELSGGESERLTQFAAMATLGGVETRVSADIRLDLWRKMMLLAPLGALSAMIRLPHARYHQLPESWRLVDMGVREVVAVGNAHGIALDETDVGNTMKLANGMQPTWKASITVDLEQGKRLEVDGLVGAVCRYGEEAGVDTPFHRVALGVLRPHAGGAT